jgi:hypothetical protein
VISVSSFSKSLPVDKEMMCPNTYFENTDAFYCGLLDGSDDKIEAQSPKNDNLNENLEANNETLLERIASDNIINNYDPFCVNVSDCYVPHPYLCELNCTGELKACSAWINGNKNK